MLFKSGWISYIIVYMSEKYFFRDSGNASFPQSKKWVSIILIWSIFNNSLERRFLAWVYDGHEKKKRYELSAWPQEHRVDPMIFLRNRSLFSAHSLLVHSDFWVKNMNRLFHHPKVVATYRQVSMVCAVFCYS